MQETATGFIAIDGVERTFEGRGGASVRALDRVDLSIAEGEFVCLIGPSGCGKTTLLNMVAGFLEPTVGDITVGDTPVRGPGPDRGVVFQEIALFPWLTAARNVEFGLKMAGSGRDARRTRAGEVLELTGLSDAADRYPHELSGGMRQRVGIARVLANDPDVLLMDEPFGALDAQTRMLMQRELVRVWQLQRKTVLFVTHGIDEAIFLGDRVVAMSPRPGRIQEIVEVDLPRPRDETSEGFNKLRRVLRELLMTDSRVD